MSMWGTIAVWSAMRRDGVLCQLSCWSMVSWGSLSPKLILNFIRNILESFLLILYLFYPCSLYIVRYRVYEIGFSVVVTTI